MYKFPKNLEATSNLRGQKDVTKQVSYSGLKKRSQFSRPGDLAPGIRAPLHSLIIIIIIIIVVIVHVLTVTYIRGGYQVNYNSFYRKEAASEYYVLEAALAARHDVTRICT